MASRGSVPKPINNPHYDKIQRLSKGIMVTAARNNKTLLKQAQITFTRQQRDFESLGLYLVKQTMWKLENDPNFVDVKFSFLCMLADYWKKPVWEFISVDYSRLGLDDVEGERSAPGVLPVTGNSDDLGSAGGLSSFL